MKQLTNSRMKRNVPQNVHCPVCSSRVTGYHYGVLTCGGCYTFFKRATWANVYHKCKDRRNITGMVGRCRGCRWEKCIKVGMFKRAKFNSACKNSATKENECNTHTISNEEDRTILNQPGNQTSLAISFVNQAAKSAFGKENRTYLEEQSVLGSLLSNDIDVRSTASPKSQYNYDTIARLEAFASLLLQLHSSTSQLHDVSQRNDLHVTRWKLFVAFWILHSPLETVSSRVAVDCDKSSRQLPSSPRAYMNCTQQLSELIGGLPLNETGRHLLMAVILCEPDSADLATTQAAVLHRYYLNALLEVVRRSCSDKSQLADITERLDKFFGTLPMVHDLVERLSFGVC